MELSVLVMTYNHQAFIRQALDSVFAQQVEVPFEVLISEDRSTDGTREIVLEYADAHPGVVRLLLSDTNVASNAVVARGLRAARGRYVALLDGDDHWLSPHKLQRQVEFMDANPECTIGFHDVYVQRDEGPLTERWTGPDQPARSTIDDLWLGNPFATCSAMLRAGVVEEIPAWYDDLFPITDWPLYLLHAEHGDVAYLDEVLGVYRLHDGGMYSPLDETSKLAATRDFYRRMNQNLDRRHDRAVKAATFRYFTDWAREYERRGDRARARACYRWALRGRDPRGLAGLPRLARMGLRLHRPRAS